MSAQIESLWETGRQVGKIAHYLYGTEDSVEIPFNRRINLMLDETRALIDSDIGFPIFEATFEHDGILVRIDVLIPEGPSWRAVEVKASTSVKDYHLLDCAIQDWVMRHVGLEVSSISLAHIDNRFVYPGQGNYTGLLLEHDLTEAVRRIEPSVVELIADARAAAAGPMPDVNVGMHCSKPYDCQFIRFCWPMDTEYPLAGLGGAKAKLGEWAALGHRDIRDVDARSITAATQLRIHHVTCHGEPEILDGAREAFSALEYPRYYLDFETISPAVPFWAGTRPYATIPVQWSCHVDDGSGDGSAASMRHEEFLDLSGEPPMRALAECLIDCVGESGPVLMYTNYEEHVVKHLIELFPDLTAPLQRIIARLYDLHPVVKENYYHPRMLGSWSIKAVMPTINPDMDYARLEGVAEGTAASAGFIEAIDPQTTPERRAELEQQLRRYCRFDTEAMVEIVRFFVNGNPN